MGEDDRAESLNVSVATVYAKKHKLRSRLVAQGAAMSAA